MLEFYKLMKNNIFFISIFLFFSNFLLAEEFDIKAKNIKIDKKSKTTIFENEVVVKDQFNNSFNADYVLYNKESNTLVVMYLKLLKLHMTIIKKFLKALEKVVLKL